MTIMDGATRQYAIGAELVSSDRVSLRVWAPDHESVDAVVDGAVTRLDREGDGFFSVVVPARAGARYGVRLEGDERVYPDPASRWLPDGPSGLSAIPDLGAFRWRDAGWAGVSLPGQVLYELHVGTCTVEGTWRAAEGLLSRLRDIGVTLIQMMPIAEFAGRFGWGYDGVQWFAPMHAYGEPPDLQHFVDAAHQAGLGVIVDVVYNHLGPSGNFLGRFDRRWQSTRHENDWGAALNFDGEGSAGLRMLVLENVRYWIREFHLDGFRIDAAQQLFDDSPEHILAAITRTAREAAGGRPVIVIAEHEPQDARLMRPISAGGFGLDGIFNEDFHHSCRVALTGVREAYFSDYRGSSREWLAAAQWGFLFQGQYYPWQRQRRGASARDCDPAQFVCFLENHDQVANSAAGHRLIDLSSPAWWRALSTLLLLGPWTPLLFQGQESGSATPFRYFADHSPDLQSAVIEGRRAFLAQFTRFAAGDVPSTSSTTVGDEIFDTCRMTGTGARSAHCERLYTDLLTMRRSDPTLAQHAVRLSGATHGDRTLLLRFDGTTEALDRLLVVNLDPDLDIGALAEPLVAPPAGHEWYAAWCSEEARYGGSGVAASTPPARLMATGHAATIFMPRARS
jgi:maltooligosyltrehalose trehalohydrolase